MNPTNGTASVTAPQFLFHLRATIGVLLLALLMTGTYAHFQTRRAKSAESALQAARQSALPTPHPAQNYASGPQAPDYYPVTLIGEDGSQTPLSGKALQIDQGGGRVLEILLQRQETGWLNIWAPLKREDTHANLVVFHPHCANSFALELHRVRFKSELADSVRYSPPAPRSR